MKGEAKPLPPPNWAWRQHPSLSNIQWLVDNANGKVISFGTTGIQRELFGDIYSPLASPVAGAPEAWERVNGEQLDYEYPIVFKGRYKSREVELIDTQSPDPDAVFLMTPEITAIYQP